eukprot:gnl/TRDRNA2_/TRDRNA2_45488_c0_seq1.p1 gnl/TRDRNA2_/TRDRNA2_45488_c0~~gnl/TRDRNA2_/TRDRNA2_45488_c0_seq1.p1  ORF type:complete len:208 (+),score=43.24 gnl/TRDRNA2_/TRDRNA2_45488_c0_seq1:175-798(+)
MRSFRVSLLCTGLLALALTVEENCADDTQGSCVSVFDSQRVVRGSQLLQTRSKLSSETAELRRHVQLMDGGLDMIQELEVKIGVLTNHIERAEERLRSNAALATPAQNDELQEMRASLLELVDTKDDLVNQHSDGGVDDAVDDACKELDDAEKAYEVCEDNCHKDPGMDESSKCEDDVCKAEADKMNELLQKCTSISEREEGNSTSE